MTTNTWDNFDGFYPKGIEFEEIGVEEEEEEPISECCTARITWHWLCSDCKEHCC